MKSEEENVEKIVSLKLYRNSSFRRAQKLVVKSFELPIIAIEVE